MAYTLECPYCNRDVVVSDVQDLYEVGVFECPACDERSRMVRADTVHGFSYWLDTQPWCCDVNCHEVAVYDIRAPLPDARITSPEEYGQALDTSTMACAKHVTPYFLMSYYKIVRVS